MEVFLEAEVVVVMLEMEMDFVREGQKMELHLVELQHLTRTLVKMKQMLVGCFSSNDFL